MRKAALLLAAVAVAGSGLWHGARAAVPMVDNTAPDRLVEAEARVGVGISSFTQNYIDQVPGMSNLNITPGCMTSFGFNGELMLRKFIGIGTGIDFNINNSRMAATIIDAPAGSLSSIFTHNRYYDFTVPVYVTLHFNLSDRIKWMVECGMFFGIGVGGHSSTDYYLSQLNALGQPVVVQNEYRVPYYQASKALINGVKDFDGGLHLATGLLVHNHFSISVALRVGMKNLAVNKGVYNVDYRSMAFSVRLGYRL